MQAATMSSSTLLQHGSQQPRSSKSASVAKQRALVMTIHSPSRPSIVGRASAHGERIGGQVVCCSTADTLSCSNSSGSASGSGVGHEACKSIRQVLYSISTLTSASSAPHPSCGVMCQPASHSAAVRHAGTGATWAGERYGCAALSRPLAVGPRRGDDRCGLLAESVAG